MIRSGIYKRLWAFGLVLALASFLLAQVIHSFENHPDHTDAAACSEAHDGKGVHLHDARYGADDCQLCAFCLKASTLPACPRFIVPLGAIADLPVCAPEDPCVKTACDSIYRRGPPVL